MGHGLPNLIPGEAQHRGHDLGHGVQNEIQRRLGRAPGQAVLLLAVQPVLDDIQVEVRQLHHAEIVHRVGDHVEVKVVIALEALLNEDIQTGDSPAVQGQHVGGGHQMVGVKAVQVAQAVPGGVAELQVVLAQLLENLLRAAHVRVVVGGGRPQADQVRAVLVHNVIGVHPVAQGLVHGLAFPVHGPAVGDAGLEGGLGHPGGAHGGEQSGLEPAPVLVQPLHVHVGGPEPLVLLHGGQVGGAGVEPPVQGVLLLGKARRLAAVGAGEAGGEDLRGVLGKPGVGALAGPTGAAGRCTSRHAPAPWPSSGPGPRRGPSGPGHRRRRPRP